MGRKRTGTAVCQQGRWYAIITLRSTRRKWVRVEDVTSPKFAHDTARALQAEYDSGKWDPEAVQPVAPPVPSVLAFARRWIEAQTYESAPKDAAAIESHIARHALGEMLITDVRPRHVRAFVDWLRSRPSKRGGTLAPRTVRNVFDPLRRAFERAKADEIIHSNPCDTIDLPPIEDKEPGAREGWIFERSVIRALTTDARVLRDRRVQYALLFYTGMRFGEFKALRIGDYERDMIPLRRIIIRRAVKSVTGKVGSTKTRAIKRVPVHPELASILDAWVTRGWREHFGRDPEPSDLMLPSVRGRAKGRPRNTSASNRAFKVDQLAVGAPTTRHQHCARHTLITLAQDDGADGSVLRWMTHAPPSSAFDLYSRGPWNRLCEELRKLRIADCVGDSVGVDPETPVMLRAASGFDSSVLPSDPCPCPCHALLFRLTDRTMHWRDLEPDQAFYRRSGGRYPIAATPYPGLRLTVDSPRRPALRFEFAPPLLFRLVAGAANILWGRIDDFWFRIEFVRDEALDPVVPPLRAEEINGIEAARGTANWYAHWSRSFARALEASPLTPLHAGTWALVPRTEPMSMRDVWPPRCELFTRPEVDPLDRDTSDRPLFVNLYAGPARVVALRTLGKSDDSRVKMWRKRARDGSLPPLLVLYVSAFDMYILLDGHDRLSAARAEGIEPPVIALVPLREDPHVPYPEKEAAVLRAAGEMLTRRVPTETVNRVMMNAFDDRPRAVPWSRVWPLPGGKAAWREGVSHAAKRMAEEERRSLIWGV